MSETQKTTYRNQSIFVTVTNAEPDGFIPEVTIGSVTRLASGRDRLRPRHKIPFEPKIYANESEAIEAGFKEARKFIDSHL